MTQLNLTVSRPGWRDGRCQPTLLSMPNRPPLHTYKFNGLKVRGGVGGWLKCGRDDGWKGVNMAINRGKLGKRRRRTIPLILNSCRSLLHFGTLSNRIIVWMWFGINYGEWIGRMVLSVVSNELVLSCFPARVRTYIRIIYNLGLICGICEW